MNQLRARLAISLLTMVAGCTLGGTSDDFSAPTTVSASDRMDADPSEANPDQVSTLEPNAREAVSAQQVTSPEVSRDVSIDPIDAPDPCAAGSGETDPRCRSDGSTEISGPDASSQTASDQTSSSAEVDLQTFQPQDDGRNQIDPARTADELARGEARSSAAQFLAQDQLSPAPRQDAPPAASQRPGGRLPNEGVVLEIIVPPAGATGQ